MSACSNSCNSLPKYQSARVDHRVVASSRPLSGCECQLYRMAATDLSSARLPRVVVTATAVLSLEARGRRSEVGGWTLEKIVRDNGSAETVHNLSRATSYKLRALAFPPNPTTNNDPPSPAFDEQAQLPPPERTDRGRNLPRRDKKGRKERIPAIIALTTHQPVVDGP